MNRRDFMRQAALVGGTASLSGISTGWGASRPRTSVSPEASGQEAGGSDPLAIHKSTLVFDGLIPAALTEGFLAELRKGGVDGWHATIGGVQAFADAYKFIDEHPQDLIAARSVRDIRDANREGKLSVVFGWQGADALGDGQNSRFGPPKTALRAYYELGLRIVLPVYNVANIFGGGCLEPEMGLTRAGRRLVEEIHGLNMALDVGGHTGEQTSLDAIEMSAGRVVMCTHSNVKALNDNPRCVSDRLIEAVAKTGGVIGLTPVNDFLVRNKTNAHLDEIPQVTVEEYADQFDYVRKLVGVDYISLASDFVVGRNIDYGNVNRGIFPREMFVDASIFVKGYENVAETPNVTAALLRRGWSVPDVRKVLGENLLRAYEQIWGA